MKVKELKNKIIIAELDPDKDYICLVNPSLVRLETLQATRSIPLVYVSDVDKAVRFIEVPKKNET